MLSWSSWRAKSWVMRRPRALAFNHQTDTINPLQSKLTPILAFFHLTIYHSQSYCRCRFRASFVSSTVASYNIVLHYLVTDLSFRCAFFRIDFHVYFVSITSLVSIHLLIHSSTDLCHHHHSQKPLLHSFNPDQKRTFSTNPSHLNKLLVLPGLSSRIIGLIRAYHNRRFIFSSIFV